MVLQALNLGILTLLFFVIGMAKPQWALFFMEKPSRWLVTAITTVFFMITMTLYGEGIQEANRVKKHKAPVAPSTVPAPAPEPVPVPIPAPEAPKKK